LGDRVKSPKSNIWSSPLPMPMLQLRKITGKI
jgi:hypothetical protein